jgi:transcriptional regulator
VRFRTGQFADARQDRRALADTRRQKVTDLGVRVTPRFPVAQAHTSAQPLVRGQGPEPRSSGYNGRDAMYIPAHFAEPRVEVLHELIRARPLCTLVTLSSAGLNANHIPLLLSAEPSPFGTLRGHVARSNPIWSDLAGDVEVLAIFHGPDAYITPSWYPTKAETGKVVPTWNYAVAHAYGRLRAIDDGAWLRTHLETLTAHNEAAFPSPWQLSDAPREYTDKLIAAVVGMEIAITRLSGKWKISQNQPAQNRAGVVAGLRANASGAALQMAALVERGGREP